MGLGRLESWLGWGRGLVWGRRGSGWCWREWSWVRRGLSQGVGEVRGIRRVGAGEVRGVRGVGVEGVGGVWVKGRVGTGEVGGLGSGHWGQGLGLKSWGEGDWGS